METDRRCPQCYQPRPYPEGFMGKRGKPIRWCTNCQANYAGWELKTPAEKAAVPRRGVPRTSELRARLFRRSGNRKLGGIPSSITSRGTCPPTCGFYQAGCYAEYHVLAAHWRRVGEKGDRWDQFCAGVAMLPEGQLWRHNEAGDLPGDGGNLDGPDFAMLVEANRGRRGFTFTHKTSPENWELFRWANLEGFTVNLSVDSLEEADRLFQKRDGEDVTVCGPVAVVVPSDAPQSLRTPAGRRVTVCPAQTSQMTCANCQLCALPHRRTIVGFRAHGQSSARVDQLVQISRKGGREPGFPPSGGRRPGAPTAPSSARTGGPAPRG